jgi:hypothetical protein
MSRQRQIKAKSGNDELTVHDHDSDSPIIPIAQIERLHEIRPDKVDWVFQQTELESLFRRKMADRTVNYIFLSEF